jgi:predicted nucleic acid-binding protein
VIVVDSSLIVDALVAVPVSPHALALVAEDELHAPTLLDYEVAGALRGLVMAGRLSTSAMTDAIENFSALIIYRHSLTDVLAEVLALRDNFTVYDAAYVVLASALDAPLVTRDAKLLEAERLGVDVRLLPAPP